MTQILDAIEMVQVGPNEGSNELRNLETFRQGLHMLYGSIKMRELRFEKHSAGKVKMFAMGINPDGSFDNLDIIACIFHWFGITLSNYVRLVGFICGLQKGKFIRDDLSDKTKLKTIKKAIDEYRDNILQFAPVQKWRDKVFAHPAITHPWSEDNIATLEMSVIYPVVFSPSGRYVVGEMVLALGSFVSELPRWSLTEVFESLVPRFWPSFEIPTVQSLVTKPLNAEKNLKSGTSNQVGSP